MGKIHSLIFVCYLLFLKVDLLNFKDLTVIMLRFDYVKWKQRQKERTYYFLIIILISPFGNFIVENV